jgi:hypothetical protein
MSSKLKDNTLVNQKVKEYKDDTSFITTISINQIYHTVMVVIYHMEVHRELCSL